MNVTANFPGYARPLDKIRFAQSKDLITADNEIAAKDEWVPGQLPGAPKTALFIALHTFFSGLLRKPPATPEDWDEYTPQVELILTELDKGTLEEVAAAHKFIRTAEINALKTVIANPQELSLDPSHPRQILLGLLGKLGKKASDKASMLMDQRLRDSRANLYAGITNLQNTVDKLKKLAEDAEAIIDELKAQAAGKQ